MVCLVVGILYVAATIILPLLPTGTSHPPQVLIWRENTPTIFPNDKIHIKYLGGIDDAFVGDFRVIYKFSHITNTGDYPKPSLYGDVAVLEFPKGSNVCVSVFANDKAVKTYRPIGYNCT